MKPESTALDWLWQLVTAPSRVVTLSSPYPPGEVLRRLNKETKVVQVLKSSQIVIRVPMKNNPRRFVARVKSGVGSGSMLIGRMQTPYRVALFRMLACLFLFGMAIVWLQVGRFWLGGIFVVGGVGFLLSSQFERLGGRDLRVHLDWLRRVLEADPCVESP